MSWNPISNPIDYFILQGKKSPGIARVQRAGSPRKFDERGGYGASGSVLVFMGRRLATFDAVIELYTVDDWDAWRAFMPLTARPPIGQRPKSLDIWHPYLVDLEIKSCVVTDALQPEPMDQGGHSITIQFQEWRQLTQSLAKPEASKNAASTDPYDKEIERLTSQLDNLAKRPRA